MNGYDLSRSWYDFAYKNKRKVKPIHHAIIHWIFECHNRSDQDEEFQLSTKEACEILGIANKDTYQIAFKELVEFGAVRMIQEAQGLYVARWISLNKCEIYLPKKQVSAEVGIVVGKQVSAEVDPVVVTVPIYKPKETKEINKQRNKGAHVRFDPKLFDLPFSSEAFKDAWINWCDHRAELRSQITEQAAKQQTGKLGKQKEEIAIHMINRSIGSGWKGLFEPKDYELAEWEKEIKKSGSSGSTKRMPVEAHKERDRRKAQYEIIIRSAPHLTNRKIEFPEAISIYHTQTGFYDELK